MLTGSLDIGRENDVVCLLSSLLGPTKAAKVDASYKPGYKRSTARWTDVRRREVLFEKSAAARCQDLIPRAEVTGSLQLRLRLHVPDAPLLSQGGMRMIGQSPLSQPRL